MNRVWWVILPPQKRGPFQIGAIKLEEFELMENGDPIHLYSIWRADSPGDILLLRLSQGRLDIADTNNEPEELFHHLTIDQFYLITNTSVLF